METVPSIFQTIPWFAWIAIVAIVCGTVQGLAQSVMRHHERIAMIRMGMNPDVRVEKPHYEEQEI